MTHTASPVRGVSALMVRSHGLVVACALGLGVVFAAPSLATAPEAPSSLAADVERAAPSVRLEPAVPRNGQPFLVDLSLPRAHFGDPDAIVVDEVSVGGRRGVPLRREGDVFTFLLSVPIEETRAALPLKVLARDASGGAIVVEKQVEVARYPYDESHLRVARKFTSPPRAARRRAARESRELDRVLARSSSDVLLAGGFLTPTTTEKTASFGTLRTYNKKKERSRHLGLDLDGATGDPVVATERGRVVLARDRYYSGNTVVVDHGGGLFSLYLHLSAYDVAEGDLVERGQLLGKVGATGRVTGPHLHFSVKLAGEHLDPETLLTLAPPAQATSALQVESPASAAGRGVTGGDDARRLAPSDVSPSSAPGE